MELSPENIRIIVYRKRNESLTMFILKSFFILMMLLAAPGPELLIHHNPGE